MARIATTLALLALCAATAPLATWAHLPLPWLIGPLITSASIAIWLPQHLPSGYDFPQRLRRVFIGLVGVMIGAQVTPDLFSDPARLALSSLVIIGFVAAALSGNYLIFRHLGGYDRATALCAGAPGGLYESIALGDHVGADPARLMLQQFLRVILVVTALPAGLSIWLGAPVGSAAGLSFAKTETDWTAAPWILAALVLGMALGPRLRLPASQLTGPLIAAALLVLAGADPFPLPQWLVNLAQIVIGTALGLRFIGLSRSLIARGIGLAALSVGAMLILAAFCGAALRLIWPVPFDVALISFAPGGLTEMALVALSLGANPAFVTLHHVIRILLTVLVMGLAARRLDL